MLDLAWKNLWMRKLRTVLTILGVGVALELVILLTTILDFTEKSIESELAKYAGQLYVRSQTVTGWAGQEFPPVSSTLKEEEARQIISEVAPRIDMQATTLVLFRPLAPPPYPNAPPQALAVGVEPDKMRSYLGEGARVKDGVANFSAQQAREVILGPTATFFFERPKVGDDVLVAGQQLRVVGLIEGQDEADRIVDPVVLMPLMTAQDVFNQPGIVSAALITASRVADVAPLAASIQEKHPTVSVLTQEEMAKNVDQALAGQRLFFNIINNTVYIVAAIVVLIVMVMAVAERTREIGTLRAIGGSRWLVLRTIVFEAMLIGLIGAMLSIPIFFALATALQWGIREVVTTWGLIQIVIVAVLVAMVAALLPAWRATRVDPVEALRYE